MQKKLQAMEPKHRQHVSVLADKEVVWGLFVVQQTFIQQPVKSMHRPMAR